MFQKSALMFVLGLLVSAIPFQATAQGLLGRPRDETAFELSISQEFGENAATAIVVNTSIPYRRLVFFLRGQRYESRYRVYLELKNAHGKQVRGEVWEESVATGTFRETSSVALAATSRRTFNVPPGDYTAVVTVEVVDTSRRFSEEEKVRVVGEGTGRLEISSAVFYTHPADSLATRPRDGEIAVSLCPPSVGETARINADGIYGDFSSWARVVINVVTPSAREASAIAFTIRIRDSKGIVVRYARRAFDGIDGGHAALCLDINIDNFVIGVYEIDVVAGTGDGAQRSESEGRFTVLFNRGLLGPRVADLVELLGIVADEKEARSVAEAPLDERDRAWASFWRKRDPTPSTESNEAFGEFLRRLQFVLASFSKSQPGWRTDMGKTYLKNGSPDKIEDRQEANMGRNYQLWYYNSKGLVYVFEDAIGTGEYRLITTEMI